MGENFIINQNLAHLGSKAANRKRDSFLSGHDQRSRCQIFSNVHCLPASTLLVVYKKLCYLLFSISVTSSQFSSNWPGWSSPTVNPHTNSYNLLHYITSTNIATLKFQSDAGGKLKVRLTLLEFAELLKNVATRSVRKTYTNKK